MRDFFRQKVAAVLARLDRALLQRERVEVAELAAEHWRKAAQGAEEGRKAAVAEVEDINNHWSSEMARAREEVADQKQEVAGLRLEIAMVRAGVPTPMELVKAEARLREVEKEREDARAAVLQSSVDLLAARGRVAELLREREQLRAESESFRSQLVAERGVRVEREAEIAELREERDDANKVANITNMEAQRIKAERDAARARVEELQRQVDCGKKDGEACGDCAVCWELRAVRTEEELSGARAAKRRWKALASKLRLARAAQLVKDPPAPPMDFARAEKVHGDMLTAYMSGIGVPGGEPDTAALLTYELEEMVQAARMMRQANEREKPDAQGGRLVRMMLAPRLIAALFTALQHDPVTPGPGVDLDPIIRLPGRALVLLALPPAAEDEGDDDGQ